MIIIFQDDMIDDVDAFVKVAEVLKERGAYKIYVMATHGLLSSDAPKLLEESCIDEVDFFFATRLIQMKEIEILSIYMYSVFVIKVWEY